MSQSIYVMWIDCGIELFILRMYLMVTVVLIEHQGSHCKPTEVYIRLLLLLVISVMKSEFSCSEIESRELEWGGRVGECVV